RDDGSDLYIPGDADIRHQHAIVTPQNGAFVITSAPDGGPVLLVTPQGEQPVQNHALHPNDTIQLGRSRMVFYTEEAA
ncbi:MAG: hypothetical protein IPH82_29615, partial [Chloroflexi bacterium]|nr:hypothetical protein [Chloroflexota bacterium]